MAATTVILQDLEVFCCSHCPDSVSLAEEISGDLTYVYTNPARGKGVLVNYPEALALIENMVLKFPKLAQLGRRLAVQRALCEIALVCRAYIGGMLSDTMLLRSGLMPDMRAPPRRCLRGRTIYDHSRLARSAGMLYWRHNALLSWYMLTNMKTVTPRSRQVGAGGFATVVNNVHVHMDNCTTIGVTVTERTPIVLPSLSRAQCTPPVYLVDQLNLFASWLIAKDFDPILPRFPEQYSRFRDAVGHVIIVYRSHLVVVGGRDTTTTHELLAPLVVGLVAPVSSLEVLV